MKKYVMDYKIGKVSGKVSLNIPDITAEINPDILIQETAAFIQALSDFNDNFRKSGATVKRHIEED